jgi:PAS domain S-box-containing protein
MTAVASSRSSVVPEPARLEAEQIRLLFASMPLGLIAGLFNAVVMIVIQRDFVADAVLALWFGLLALLTAARFGLLFAYRRADPPAVAARPWGLAHAAGAALTGAVWGSAGVLLFPDDLAHQMFTVFLLAGMTAGGVVAFYAHMWVALLFIVPTLVPLIVRLLTDPHHITMAMGVMAVLFLTLMVATARRMHLVTLNALRLRFENSELVDNLASEKREFQILNEDLRREIGERIRIEQGLRDSEGRIRAIVDNVLDGIVTMDDQGQLQSCNPAAGKIFQCAPDEMIGRHFRELLAADDREAYEALLREQTAETGARMLGFGLEVSGLRKGGKPFPMELGVSSVALAGRRLFIAIVRDITERRQVERLKSRFVAAVSHELRTPLTSLMGSLGLLSEGVAGELSERGRSLLGIARSNVERLARLVADILDFDEIQSGRILLHLKPLDLVTLVEQAVENQRVAATGRTLELVYAPAARVATVRADHERLLHVLDHLLSNAIKFSPPKAPVAVTLEARDGQVRVTVRDRGPGVPEEFRSRVFDSFAQADIADANHPGGTGIGLTIARAIVELHGGRIGFDSTPGHGASFWFELPQVQEGAAH